MEAVEICSVCGQEHPKDTLTEFDDALLCPACLEEETLLCSECGERIWRDDNEGSDDVILCSRCYENEYTHCTRCGRLLRNEHAYYLGDDDDPFCEHCYMIADASPIHEYGYKPDPIFYGTGPRYFGVELEIDEAGERNRNAEALLDIGNRDAVRIYCKHDGSLSDGFEIVTHPMSLEYHEKNMPWEEIMDKAVSMGYRSHQAGTCGLHVHVSRAAFGDTDEGQDTAIARTLFFVEKHWNELLRFSRRTQRQLDHWAARYGYKDHPGEMMEHIKKGSRNRYTCVNLTNEDTIEFRIFRGTLKYNTLIATLQMVQHICDVALYLSDDELKALSWSEFVSSVKEPELIQYLKERRLYLNEPVESEADV